jgi:hypothetical protein
MALARGHCSRQATATPIARRLLPAILAARDGQTLLMAGLAMFAVNPVIYPRMPFDPAADFALVTGAASTPRVLVTRPCLAEPRAAHHFQDRPHFRRRQPLHDVGRDTRLQRGRDLLRLALLGEEHHRARFVPLHCIHAFQRVARGGVDVADDDCRARGTEKCGQPGSVRCHGYNFAARRLQPGADFGGPLRHAIHQQNAQ